jgi:hypothetical protein
MSRGSTGSRRPWIALELGGGALALESADVTHHRPVDHDGCEEELVGAVALLRRLAVDQGVGEPFDVPGGAPDLRVHDDRGLDPHDIVAALDHVPPPAVAEIPLQLHTQRTVVEETIDPPVDVGGGKDEAAPFAQRNQGIHGHFGGRGTGHRRAMVALRGRQGQFRGWWRG